MVKVCNKCKVTKPLTHFYRERGNITDGRRGSCKKCKESQTIAWRLANREHINAYTRMDSKRNRLRNRLYRYGLTPAQFQEMLIAQGSLCKICKKLTNDKTLVVDHCHTTGAVRGLLCRKCNTLISLLDKPDLYASAWAYVKKLA